MADERIAKASSTRWLIYQLVKVSVEQAERLKQPGKNVSGKRKRQETSTAPSVILREPTWD